MTRPIEEQRKLCARFMGYQKEGDTYVDHSDLTDKPENHIVACFVSDYHPDEDLQQANELKKKLLADTYTFSIWHWGHSQDVAVTIHPKAGKPDEEIITQCRLKTEAAALTAAVAELQASIEERPADE